MSESMTREEFKAKHWPRRMQPIPDALRVPAEDFMRRLMALQEETGVSLDADDGAHLTVNGILITVCIEDGAVSGEAYQPVPEEEADTEIDVWYPEWLEAFKRGGHRYYGFRTREQRAKEGAERHAYYFGPRVDAVENKRRYLAGLEEKP